LLIWFDLRSDCHWKIGLALALAIELGSVIISADSRQVYREFDIGTAKPTSAERQRSHYLIDICAPTETLTVADYQQQAQALINQFHHPSPHHLTTSLVGGSIHPFSGAGIKIPRVAPHRELRSQLQSLGQPQMYAMLQQVDPAAEKIHPHDPVRTLRALEVFYTGCPISEQQGEHPPTIRFSSWA